MREKTGQFRGENDPVHTCRSRRVLTAIQLLLQRRQQRQQRQQQQQQQRQQQQQQQQRQHR
ncbi:unnamed protein product, partial [Rotaria sordida]